MWNEYPKPRWWRLYAILPLTVALLAIDSQLALPSLGHKLVEIMIVLLSVVLMGLWVAANAVALEWSDIADDHAHGLRAYPAAPSMPGDWPQAGRVDARSHSAARLEAASRRTEGSSLRAQIDMAVPGAERNN